MRRQCFHDQLRKRNRNHWRKVPLTSGHSKFWLISKEEGGHRSNGRMNGEPGKWAIIFWGHWCDNTLKTFSRVVLINIEPLKVPHDRTWFCCAEDPDQNPASVSGAWCITVRFRSSIPRLGAKYTQDPRQHSLSAVRLQQEPYHTQNNFFNGHKSDFKLLFTLLKNSKNNAL